MNGRDFEIREVPWHTHKRRLLAVREAVFVAEQGVPAPLERDAADPYCLHLLATEANGRAIATARMSAEGHIGRMAVLHAWRGRGVGSALLHRLMERARTLGLAEVRLNAQLRARAFYDRHGFVATGLPFREAGIEHLHMHRTLTGASGTEAAPPPAGDGSDPGSR